jgi:hypothetical protein
MDDPSLWIQTENILTDINLKFNFYFNTSVFSGIGTVRTSIETLPSSYFEARIALSYYNLFGDKGVVYIKNVVRVHMFSKSITGHCLVYHYRCCLFFSYLSILNLSTKTWSQGTNRLPPFRR